MNFLKKMFTYFEKERESMQWRGRERERERERESLKQAVRCQYGA